MSTVTEANPRLRALTDAGVSVWLDQISRTLVAGGELARLVADRSLRGVTSNPSIFEKSILGTSEYDDADRRARPRAASTPTRSTTPSRLPTSRVPPTCSPESTATLRRARRLRLDRGPADLARDTAGTIAGGPAVLAAVGRPNTMIKIPGTAEGVGAIEQAIYEGINVNVTLLFAVSAYSAIAEAYIRGLERRAAEDLPLTSTPSRASSSPGSTRTSTSGWRQLGAAELARNGRARERPRRLRPLQGDLLRTALGRAGRRRCRRPAAAVGVDGREEPALPRHPVRRQSDRRAHGQHDAAGDARGRSPTMAASPGRPPSTTTARTCRRSPRPASTSSRSPTSC